MHVDSNQRWTQRLAKSACLSAIALLWTTPVMGTSHDVADIAPFGLLDIDGDFSARYSLNDQERDAESAANSFESRTTWEQEFSLMTRSFVYHPGFLNMDLGGGPLLVQQQFDSNSGDNKNNETLVNFLGRLNFLEFKAYPFSLYYQRSHPSFTTSLAGSFLTEKDEQGFSGRINNLFSSTTLKLDLSHRDTIGSGFGSVVDEDVDQGSLAVVTSYRGGDRIELKYEQSERNSASGSPGLPIQPSRLTIDNSEIRTRNFFGVNKQIVVDQFAKRLIQETTAGFGSKLESLSYTGSSRWLHSDTTRSQFRYRLNESKRIDLTSKSQNADLSIFHTVNEGIGFNAGINHSSERQPGFRRDLIGANGAVSYSRTTRFGTFGLSGRLRQERADQEASEETIQVFDEPLVLTGTIPSNLANDFVQEESVTITNVAMTQTFVEGIDYRLVTIGSTTSVQRLIGGSIADGQTVLSSYRYFTSGTAEFDVATAGLSVTANFLKYVNAYANFNTRQTDVRSGELLTPAGDGDSIELGVGASYPLINGWTIGGQVRHQDQDGDLSPFVRDSIDLSLAASLFGSVRLLVSGGILEVDYENSTEDVSQVIYRLGLSGRLLNSIQVGYDASYLSDSGGSLPRDQLQHRLNFQWAYRQVRFLLRAQYSDYTQGTTERGHTQVTAQLTRSF